MEKTYRAIMGVLAILLGLGLMVWLSLGVMLYGGLMQAVSQWGINDTEVVWGVLKAMFCSVGAFPGAVVFCAGIALLK